LAKAARLSASCPSFSHAERLVEFAKRLPVVSLLEEDAAGEGEELRPVGGKAERLLHHRERLSEITQAECRLGLHEIGVGGVEEIQRSFQEPVADFHSFRGPFEIVDEEFRAIQRGLHEAAIQAQRPVELIESRLVVTLVVVVLALLEDRPEIFAAHAARGPPPGDRGRVHACSGPVDVLRRQRSSVRRARA
jgi:hypothetical protein